MKAYRMSYREEKELLEEKKAEKAARMKRDMVRRGKNFWNLSKDMKDAA